MKIYEISNVLENLAPLAYAEDFDNVGLLLGNSQQEVSSALLTLDCTEEVIKEAIEKQVGLIITFHPIMFKGLKRITGNNYVERVVIKAIKHDIAIYAIHTNLDFAWKGSNRKLCEKLNLSDIQVLLPKKKTIKKLTTYVPIKSLEKVRFALFDAGAGNIGNYDHCSFNIKGEGSFRGGEESRPTLGKPGEMRFEKEICLNVTFPAHLEKNIIDALKKVHPYEEVAYEVIQLTNENQHVGIGMYGNLPQSMNEKNFLAMLRSKIPTDCIRHTRLTGKKIQKVAVLGGSGSFGLNRARQIGADAYISADFKYHEFFRAENQILICDVGHYESEQFIKSLLYDVLIEKFPNFALSLSEVNTNPIYYY